MKRGCGFFTAAGLCLLAAVFFRFALVGYSFSAYLLCALAAVLAFYGLMARWGSRTARLLSVLCTVLLAVGLILFAIAEVPVWRYARSDQDTDAPYIIVMGAAVHGSTPSLSMTERTRAAYEWLLAHPDGVAVVSGGQGGGEDVSEARAMFDLLTGWGIPPERVLMESLSTSSYENLLFSLRVIEDHGGDPNGPVALCSSEYHLCRLVTVARSLGCQPIRVAARTGHVTLRLNYAVREAFGLWRVWLLGPG